MFEREVQNKEAEQFELEEKVQMIKENPHFEICFNEEQEDRIKPAPQFHKSAVWNVPSPGTDR